MTVRRRVSATFKDVPGGQILGPTFDYTHRLLDFSLAVPEREREPTAAVDCPKPRSGTALPGHDERGPKESEGGVAPFGRGSWGAISGPPRVIDVLDREGLIEPERSDDDSRVVGDITREPLVFPAARDVRLQNLARADEGFVLALGYATQRGYGRNHPFAAEIRIGEVELELAPEELGFSITIGELSVTECQMVNQFTGSAAAPPQFTRGYGLTFGHTERKAMAMALVDRALRARELGEAPRTPPQDEEFVLYHSDNVEASGFVQHLKLPHHVDFQSELVLLRTLRAEAGIAPETTSP